MKINPTQSTTTFASITGISKFQKEEEVLFSMHSVFRIHDIKQMGGNNRLYEVNLILTADNDPELSRLTDYTRTESFPDNEGWERLGFVLFKMGQFNKAEDIYQVLLDQTKNDEDKTPIYIRLGMFKMNQGKYEEALTFYEQSIAIKQKTLAPNRLNLAISYNNIGLVHYNMGDYPQALLSLEKALEIRQISLPSSHPDLAASYNNIGVVHKNIGNYSKALSSHEKALEIWQQSLSPNHPDLASSYNNIGLVYKNMANYQKALSFHEKALEIKQQSLPPNHPDLAMSFGHMGNVYNKMGQHSKALPFCQRAVDIAQQSLPSNHSHLQWYRNNLEDVKKQL
ncbi:unnamed protein product [Adineta steineri]|nr:unnamed protein product [Adineta steineri]